MSFIAIYNRYIFALFRYINNLQLYSRRTDAPPKTYYYRHDGFFVDRNLSCLYDAV